MLGMPSVAVPVRRGDDQSTAAFWAGIGLQSVVSYVECLVGADRWLSSFYLSRYGLKISSESRERAMSISTCLPRSLVRDG